LNFNRFSTITGKRYGEKNNWKLRAMIENCKSFRNDDENGDLRDKNKNVD
jgi:hypothetical protein